VETETDTDGRREIEADTDCPICYDAISGCPDSTLTWCRAGCGNSIHKACWTEWSKNQKAQGKKPTCVYCRSVWVDETAAGAAGATKVGGYLNLAAVAGMTGARDTSSCEFCVFLSLAVIC
jgi:hypothetical protein